MVEPNVLEKQRKVERATKSLVVLVIDSILQTKTGFYKEEDMSEWSMLDSFESQDQCIGFVLFGNSSDII